MATQSKPFLGIGWDFPPAFDKASRSTVMLQGEADIRSSLYILVSTALGERIMREEYGTDIGRLVFEPMDEGLKSYLKDMITDAIHLHEPRVNPNAVGVETDPVNGKMIVNVDYTILQTNSRANVVFPYYLSEGNL